MIGRKGCFQQFEAFDFFEKLQECSNQMQGGNTSIEIVNNKKTDSQHLPQICLIDRDVQFCESLAKFAESQQLELDWFLNFQAFSKASSHHWDFILVGIESEETSFNMSWASDIFKDHLKTPIILVSSKKIANPRFSNWPKNVVGFSEKGKSLEELVDYLGRFKKDNFDLGTDKLPVPSYLELQIKN